MNSALLQALGGLGLFLLGMVIMTDGLRALAGRSLRRMLTRFTRSPTSGVVTGAVSTAIIQSSSATTVAAVGFVGAGLLTFPQALGIIFGANIGTTITGWLVAILGFKLNLDELVLPLLLVGVLIRLFSSRRWSPVGTAISGFCLIFIGIAFIQSGMGSLQHWVTPESFPEDGILGRLLLVAIGAGITLVTQSSSAGVATAMAALSSGAITYPQAAAMVIGMNVGTTCTAMIATIGASTSAKRTGIAHLIYNCITAVGALLLLSPFVAASERISPGILTREPELGLVAFHTLFNGLGVILILPFTAWFARAIIRLVPGRETHLTEALDERLLRNPVAALQAVGQTIHRASRRGFSLLSSILSRPLEEPPTAPLDEIEATVEETRAYLDRLSPGMRTEEVERPYAASVHALDHLERLVQRIRRRRPLTPEVLGPELAKLRGRLELSIPATEVDEIDLEGLEAEIEPIWEELEEREEPSRKNVLRQCAAGELSLELAHARLGAERWLRRATYHVWRIVHHLRRVEGADEPPIPPRGAKIDRER